MKRDWPLYLILALGAAARIVGLGWDALWYDEAFTAWLAGLPLADMLDAIAGDVHPPAWYLIEWATVRLLGSSELALRLPACLIGCFNMWLAWSVAQRLAPRPVALLAVAIFALCPFQIYYSQEARMYQLLQSAVLLAVLAILTRRWPLLAGASLAGLLTHNMMAVYLVAIFGLALWTRRGQPTGVLVAAGVTGVNYAPWAAWLLLPQLGEVNNSFWVQPLSPGGFFYPLYILFLHVATPERWQLHAGLLVVGLVVWGSLLIWHRPDRQPTTSSLLILAWGPLLVLALISLVWRPVYLHRTLIGVSLFVYLLAAFAMVHVAGLVKPVGLRGLVLLGLCLPLLISTGNFYLSPLARRWDVRAEVESVRCKPGAGDVVYHVNLASLILFRYYLPECEHLVWPVANDLSQSLTQRTKRAMGMLQVEPDDIPRHLYLVWAETPVMNPGEPPVVGKILLLNNYMLLHESQPAALVTLRIWEVWR